MIENELVTSDVPFVMTPRFVTRKTSILQHLEGFNALQNNTINHKILSVLLRGGRVSRAPQVRLRLYHNIAIYTTFFV